MHELVHSILHSRLFAWLRLPSFAGDGLPERMRSTTFALLGLTAAGGLGLVAIFAQPGFTLLTPAPLPAEPSLSESVGGAEKVTLYQGAAAFVPAAHGASPQGAPRRSPGSGASVDLTSETAAGSPAGVRDNAAAPGGVAVLPPISSPETSAGNNGGGGAENEPGGGSGPAPTAAPAPVASPPATAAAPPPTTSPPKATTASSAAPKLASGPGHSSSGAAASHASERGIEASASPGPPPSVPATAPPAAPESSSQPGNGNGLAKGHDK